MIKTAKPQALLRDAPAEKKPVAKARVSALEFGEIFETDEQIGTSLLEDYDGSSRQPKWRVHDRTHLEFSVDYPITDARNEEYVWEAYFYIPRSLKVNRSTYSKKQMYRDLQSYVRLSLPPLTFAQIRAAADAHISPLFGYDSQKAIREMRLFASQLRRSVTASLRLLRRALREHDATTLEEGSLHLVSDTAETLDTLREVFAKATREEEQLSAAWVDEDCSRLVEGALADWSIRLRKAGYESLAKQVASGAVREAQYRIDQGLGGIGKANADKRDIEHLEFRRHLLRRFSASVLWLRREISEAGKWTLQALYAIAASVAMAFAVGATFYHGTPNDQAFEEPWFWVLVVMLAYAGKDRIKASLQTVFSKWVAKWLPDRRWRLETRGDQSRIGTVKERSAFVSQSEVPDDVYEARTSTHQHRLELQARPEHVLWHQKEYRLRNVELREFDTRFSAVTEIFRLDLSQWLTHTDDPKQPTVFADAEDQRIYSAMAPRVYNIAVVYRLRRKSEANTPWRRVRVVISRKGIKRVEKVELL